MIFRILRQVMAIFLIVAGGLWTLQGLNLVRWPSESFMLDQNQWAIYGVITAAAGAILLWLGRRP